MISRAFGIPLIITVAAVVLTAGARPEAQQPGAVRGRVSIGIPVTAKRSSSTYSRSIATVALAPESELRHVVVYLKDAPKGAVSPVHAEIRQENENFVPRVVAVPVGSEVDFPNDDPIYHNVFSLSRARTFDLGRYPVGRSKAVRFDRPGIVRQISDGLQGLAVNWADSRMTHYADQFAGVVHLQVSSEQADQVEAALAKLETEGLKVQ